MSISVQCPGCEKKLKTKDELAGKRIKCPGCGQVFQLPACRQAPVPADGGPTAATPASATKAGPAPAAVPPRLWVLKGANEKSKNALVLAGDVLGYLESVPPATCDEIRAEFEEGRGSLATLGRGALIVPLSEITGLEQRVRSPGRFIEIVLERGPDFGTHNPLVLSMVTFGMQESFLAVTVRRMWESVGLAPKSELENLFAALAQTLGTGWHRRTTRKFKGWDDKEMGVGSAIFITMFLGLLTAIGYHWGPEFPDYPWPFALAGCVVLVFLTVLLCRKELYGLATWGMLANAGLIASALGQIGIIILGVFVIGLYWWFWFSFFVTVDRTTRVTR